MTTIARDSKASPWGALTDQERDLVEEVGACVHSFEAGIGTDLKEKYDRLYNLYRGFKRWRQPWEVGTENDRDVAIREGKQAYGSNLAIPVAFSTIETMVPGAIAQRPRMLYLPRRPEWGENAEHIRELIDRQQDAVDIELTWQDMMRSGFIYGLGAGKSFWRKEFAQRRRVKPRQFGARFGMSKYFVTDLTREVVFDDPDLEDVDIYDLMWDPYGYDVKSCGWMLHRLWMSNEDVMYRLQSGMWGTEAAAKLLEEPALWNEGGLYGGDSQKYDEIWQDRMSASGLNVSNMRGSNRPHEVWEYHNGHEVLTVLDRAVLVQQGESPLVGHMPFHIYRPTPLQKQMVGIGEIEPIESLSSELDTLRSMMLDAGVIAMCAGYAYDDNAIEEDDLVFGPASAIRVTGARPSDALFPLPKPDLPSSAFNQAAAIMSDIERVTGINDALAGGDGGSISTATEAQLVQASLSKRVDLKSRRFEVEVCRAAARAWLYLNQRMILAPRPEMLPDTPGMGFGEAASTGAWKHVNLGPEELAGDFLVMPEGGSMAAENVPQMRADAQALMAFEGNDHINQRMLLLKRLELNGIKRPHEWLNPEAPPIPPEFIDILVKSGRLNPDMVRQLLEDAQHMHKMLPPEGGQQAPQGPPEQAQQALPAGGG